MERAGIGACERNRQDLAGDSLAGARASVKHPLSERSGYNRPAQPW